MNCGFSNLDTLKKNLLPATMLADTRFDAVIKSIGLGVAAQFGTLCNRKFVREENATDVFAADRCQFALRRYPVETVTQWELKQTEADGFVVQDMADILTVDTASGLVHFPDSADVGQYFHQVRFTYTGGYWFETLEPDDSDYPSTPPAGAILLDDSLRLNWLLQCRQVWNSIDRVGDSLISESTATTALSETKIIPAVKEALSAFIRYQLA